MSSSLPSLLIPLAMMLPVYAVWLVAIIVALVRWPRHPRVSAIAIASLGSLLLLSVTQRIVTYLVIDGMNRSGQGAASMGIYLSILNLASMLGRTVAWAAILVALFGWRQAEHLSPLQRPTPFQFSIRGIMFLTLAVALLCALIRWLIGLLGESATFLLSLIDDVPLFICWLMGLRVAILRWNRHPEVSMLAVTGIGLLLAINVIWQVAFMAMLMSQSFGRTGMALDVVAVLCTAAGWALVLVAVLGRREPVETVEVRAAPIS